MMVHRYIRIVIVLGMVAVICGTVSAAVGIIAETQTTSAGVPPVCTGPCECISENEAAQRWGTEGYERCSKSICGQSANADIPYYCLHQIGGTSSSPVTTCQAPCECLSESGAISRWGRTMYTQCSMTACGEEATGYGTVSRYCFRPWGSSLVIGRAATTAPTAAAQQTVQAPAQTPAVQATITGTVITVSPSYNWPTPGEVQQKTPVGIITILAAIGAALVAAAAMRRK